MEGWFLIEKDDQNKGCGVPAILDEKNDVCYIFGL